MPGCRSEEPGRLMAEPDAPGYKWEEAAGLLPYPVKEVLRLSGYWRMVLGARENSPQSVRSGLMSIPPLLVYLAWTVRLSGEQILFMSVNIRSAHDSWNSLISLKEMI